MLLQGTKGVAGRAGDDAPEKQAGVNNGWSTGGQSATNLSFPVPAVQCQSQTLLLTSATSIFNTVARGIFFLIQKKKSLI